MLIPLATRAGGAGELYDGLWLGWVGAAAIAVLGIGAAVLLPKREQPAADEPARGTPMSSASASGQKT